MKDEKKVPEWEQGETWRPRWLDDLQRETLEAFMVDVIRVVENGGELPIGVKVRHTPHYMTLPSVRWNPSGTTARLERTLNRVGAGQRVLEGMAKFKSALVWAT